MNGVQTRFKCKLDVKRCKRFVFPPSSLLPRSNALKTKAIRYFQTDRTLTRIVSPPLVLGKQAKRFVFFDLEKSALENVGTYAKQIELSASVEIHHADSSRGTIELLPSLPTSSFIHIDPYEIDKKGGSGVTYLDVLIQATLLGMKCLLWYGFMTGDDKASLDNYITSSLEKAGIKDYTGVELTMNSIRKDSVLCNPGILGSGILATNVSQTSKDIILDYSNQLVDIYKDAKYKDYDGSLYIQHL